MTMSTFLLLLHLLASERCNQSTSTYWKPLFSVSVPFLQLHKNTFDPWLCNRDEPCGPVWPRVFPCLTSGAASSSSPFLWPWSPGVNPFSTFPLSTRVLMTLSASPPQVGGTLYGSHTLGTGSRYLESSLNRKVMC